MFEKSLPIHYQDMMADLEDYAYSAKFYLVYDGAAYKGIAISEDNALSLAVEYDNPAIYAVDKDEQTSHRVY